ncbi:hypothetical protein GQ53DRAFT_314951 [Thozetella sp. PMI_491]|nr:hypothetical protein GQ53DRAFT_314951 [Thozetella sp. PMI_491]
MGKNKKAGPGPPAGQNAKDRHNKERKQRATIDWTIPAPAELVARPNRPQPNPRHKSYMEFVENSDKKKKLEYRHTHDPQPPPGFEFVPVGNPDLTAKCKELSREQEVLMFIVSIDSRTGLTHRSDVGLEIGRIGYHFRQTIADAARELLGLDTDCYTSYTNIPEPIPQTQEEINDQADKAIRDLFPRIPHTDRQAVVDRAFNIKDRRVGMFSQHNLSKRVQLAVLAHIRHNYTRYDQLLKETKWENARKAVESLCLDYLVKWRGDEENGRDQLDEVLREVIVISDSESDDDSEDNDDSLGERSAAYSEESLLDLPPSEDQPPLEEPKGNPPAVGMQPSVGATQAAQMPGPIHTGGSRRVESRISGSRMGGSKGKQPMKKRPKKAQKQQQQGAKAVAKKEANTASRGFKRYQAVRDQAWREAVERVRVEPHLASPVAGSVPRDVQSPRTAPEGWNNARASLPRQANMGPRDPSLPGHGEESYGFVPSLPLVPRDTYNPHSPRIASPLSGPPGHLGADSNRAHRELGSRHGDGLRDYLVKSVEACPPDDVSFAKGFIQLPPREARNPVDSRYRPENGRNHGPPSGPSNYDQGYIAARRDDGLLPPAMSEPRRQYHNDVGSESNPIILLSSPQPRLMHTEPTTWNESRPMLNGPRPVPRVAEVIDLRTHRPASPALTPRGDGAVDRWGSHFGGGDAAQPSEIVRVSNKFPRRYEPQPDQPLGYATAMEHPRYDLRSAHRPSAGRIVSRVVEPVYTVDRGAHYVPSYGQPSNHPLRQERVVGVEYVPVGQSTHGHSGQTRPEGSYAPPYGAHGAPPAYR